jgi:hypothetical protein
VRLTISEKSRFPAFAFFGPVGVACTEKPGIFDGLLCALNGKAATPGTIVGFLVNCPDSGFMIAGDDIALAIEFAATEVLS